MPDLKLRRNSFQQVLIKLEYDADSARPADLFSRACLQHFSEFSLDRYGYSFTQVFEPGVLQEVAALEGRPYGPLADLTDRPSPAIARLAELVAGAADLPVVALVNLASALITISRFDPARRVLQIAEARAVTPRERLEVALLEFMVSNRRDDGAGSPAAFRRMRAAIETGQVPPERVIDVCSQAVVWYLKRKELTEDDFRFYVMAGCAVAKNPGRIDPAPLSAWNRAVAMLPADMGQAAQTRHYMVRAREAAEQAISRRPRPYELNFIKTYYESTIKEHLYVTRDFGKAIQAGEALIALDPVWGPSYGELAEVYQRSGDTRRAAGLYEQAAELGPPYVGHHLLRAARCRAALGEHDRVAEHHLTLSRIVQTGAREAA